MVIHYATKLLVMYLIKIEDELFVVLEVLRVLGESLGPASDEAACSKWLGTRDPRLVNTEHV